MKLSLKIPGKTFLAGEYSVLKGGKALLWSSAPYFECIAKSATRSVPSSFHPDSPAGKFLQSHRELQSFEFEFIDPYKRGGFGASTAQYLAVRGLLAHLQGQKTPTGQNLILEYLEHAYSGEGTPPSGVDLWAQREGGLLLLDKKQNSLEKIQWPFAGVMVLFVHTGHKLATHEHLKARLSVPESELKTAFAGLELGLQAKDLEKFLAGLSHFSESLSSAGLMCENSQKLQREFLLWSGVLAAKPCGAMGSDVVALVVEASQQGSILKRLKNLPELSVLTSLSEPSQGLSLEVLES